MIKTFLRVLSLSILGGSFLFADQVASTRFKGLNNNENSVIIGPEYAQDLLNVNVTPGGKSVKKRSGYGLFTAIPGSFHGGYHFFDSSGNDVQLWGQSVNLQSIVNGDINHNVAVVSSATLNSTWDCADTQGSAYCVDSNRDAYIKTNGATMTWYPTPLGTMVETTPDRVVVAGISGSPNTLYVSQSNTFTNFTTGVNATDAFTEVIASPGSKLTHIRWGCGKLLWWKDASFGYFDFDDQYTAQVKTVSDTIGTFDNTSAIDPGGRVWFRGQDGHTWMYDCSFLTKESIDITPNVQQAGHRTSNLWTQTTQSDFNSGSGYATFTDTATVSGSVRLSGLQEVWASSSSWATISGSFTLNSGTIVSTSHNPFISDVISSTASLRYPLNIPNQNIISATIYFNNSMASPRVTNQTGCIASVNATSNSGYGLCLIGTGDGKQQLNITASTKIAPDFSTYVSSAGYVADNTTHTITLSRSATGYISAYYDGVFSTGTLNTDVNSFNNYLIGCQNQSNESCQIGAFYATASTGTYYSPVHNAPSLNGWSTLGVNTVLNGGTETFYMRSSTNSFSVFSATPAWTAQAGNSLIGVSTGTYFQVRDDFALTTVLQTPTLNDFTVNWFEGTSTDQAYMIYFDNAIWEAVPYGTSQATNNYVFKYDLINDGWTIYDIPMNGMLIQNNQLYFGGPINYLYIYGNSTSDYGSNPPNPITAYWRTKSFSGNDPFLQSQLTNIDVFAKKDNGGQITATYTTDTSTATAYVINTSSSNAFIQSRKLLPSGKLGNTFDLKVGDASASTNWELFGYRIGFAQQPYRPTQ